MSEAAAVPASPSNFSAVVRGNLAAAPAPSAPAQPPASQSQPSQVTSIPAPTQNDALPPQEPANDNAQPPPEQQLGQEQAPPEDPWMRQLHGVPVRELVDALERGELPEPVLNAIKGIAKVNGKELPVSLREALNGYMRLTDHTQKTQELAKHFDELDNSRGQLRALFDGWDSKPEVFAQGMERMGLMPQVRSVVTREWGTAEQPNVEGYMGSMRRLGHWNTFQAAAKAYASWYSQRLNAFNPAGTQEGHARAVQMIKELESEQAANWKARVEAEGVTESARREQWKRERDQMLAQRRQQPQQNEHAQIAQQIGQLRSQQLLQLGILNANSTQAYVEAVHQRFESAMGQLVGIARRSGAQESLESLVSKAAQIVAEHIAEAPRTPAQQPPAQGLPVRPAGAPTTNGAGVHGQMSPRQLEQFIRGGGRR